MIRFQNVTKIYKGSDGLEDTVALQDILFDIRDGELVSLVGRSGAGKTTLLKMILAEEKPSRGRVFFEGRDLSRLQPEELPELRKKIGSIFQDYKLLPSKTVYDNVAYVLEVIGASDFRISQDVAKVLDIVGLSDKARNLPAELSAGEKQRVSIARALIHRPKIILADEPTGNLDPYNTLDIIKLLLKIHKMGTTLILATHDKEIVNRLGKRVITLEEGRIIRDEKRGRFIL